MAVPDVVSCQQGLEAWLAGETAAANDRASCPA
jgi:hypothetical protein